MAALDPLGAGGGRLAIGKCLVDHGDRDSAALDGPVGSVLEHLPRTRSQVPARVPDERADAYSG